MNITVYCGSSDSTNPHFEEAARELGCWIARQGHTLVYGGSSVGLMGVISKAAINAGGQVIGIEPRFFIDAGVAQHDLTELIVVDTMSERKAKMIELGDAFIALPGGVGTLEEISEIMSRIRLGLSVSACYLLDIDGFYTNLKDFLKHMVDQEFLDQVDLERICFPTSVAELLSMMQDAQARNIQPFATAAELG